MPTITKTRMPSRRMPKEDWPDFLGRVAMAIETRNRTRQARKFPKLLKKAKFKVGRKVFFARGGHFGGLTPLECWVANVALSQDRPPKIIYDLSTEKGAKPELLGIIEEAIFPTRRLRKGI